MKWLRNALILTILLFSSTISFSFAQSISFSATVDGSSLTFGGYTSPVSLIVFSENNVTIGSTTSNISGAFSKEFSFITPGIHSITIFSYDSNGTLTKSIKFNLLIIANQQMNVSNIYLPPTLGLNGSSFGSNDIVIVSGYTRPNSAVKIDIKGNSTVIRTITSNNEGKYSLLLSAADFSSGDYTITAELVIAGIIDNSTLSNAINFKVNNGISSNTPIFPTSISLCPNRYQRLCLFDKQKLGYLDEKDEFLLFLTGYIKYTGQDFDIIYDINEDKHVNSLDLSIVLYYWRGDNNSINGEYSTFAMNNTVVLGTNDSQVKGVGTQISLVNNSQISETQLMIGFLTNEFYVVLVVLCLFTVLVLGKKLIAKRNDSR